MECPLNFIYSFLSFIFQLDSRNKVSYYDPVTRIESRLDELRASIRSASQKIANLNGSTSHGSNSLDIDGLKPAEQNLHKHLMETKLDLIKRGKKETKKADGRRRDSKQKSGGFHHQGCDGITGTKLDLIPQGKSKLKEAILNNNIYLQSKLENELKVIENEKQNKSLHLTAEKNKVVNEMKRRSRARIRTVVDREMRRQSNSSEDSSGTYTIHVPDGKSPSRCSGKSSSICSGKSQHTFSGKSPSRCPKKSPSRRSSKVHFKEHLELPSLSERKQGSSSAIVSRTPTPGPMCKISIPVCPPTIQSDSGNEADSDGEDRSSDVWKGPFALPPIYAVNKGKFTSFVPRSYEDDSDEEYEKRKRLRERKKYSTLKFVLDHSPCGK